ncbi:MAG: hypothetical protein JRN13_03450 [Nitrososphaerota archaeon]|nr:hypothetical protein [Nitrososphaerota archaeon]MDG6957114.1 hypothetical protein [Nitrososphaerota archaeon]MDG6962460.1 hypothetical protein [Nitrososphaerota archaeon]MDG6972379.1 hypothetical protein [Nitrososphaerota archaeon]MDG6980115.1 hypothetical protein [Nitrososphaerota archaeon]
MAASSPRGRTLLTPWVLLALSIGLAARVTLLVANSHYFTDVSYYNAQAVGYLLRGVDPYGAFYAAPSGLATPGAAEVFAYLPGIFVFIAPAGALGAATLGMVATDLVTVVSLSLLGPRGPLSSMAYFLFPPVVLFSTYLINDSLPAIAFVAVAMLAEAKGRPKTSAVFWGLAFGASVEAWLAFPFYAAFSLRRRRTIPPLLSVLTATAVALPFLAWDPAAFVLDTVLFQFQRSPLPLVYAGAFGPTLNPSLQGIFVSLGGSAPTALRVLLALAALAVLLWRCDGSLGALALGSGCFAAVALFLLPGVAFWSYFELPLMLLAAWYALRGSAFPRLKEQNQWSHRSDERSRGQADVQDCSLGLLRHNRRGSGVRHREVAFPHQRAHRQGPGGRLLPLPALLRPADHLLQCRLRGPLLQRAEDLGGHGLEVAPLAPHVPPALRLRGRLLRGL